MTRIGHTRLEAFMGQVMGHMTGSALCFGVWPGDELGAPGSYGTR